MSFEVALSARILADVPLADELDERVDWMRRPGSVLPAFTLQTVSDPRPQHLKGFHPTRPTSVQLDVWAADLATAIRLRERAIVVLVAPARVEGVQFQRAMITNVRPGFESEEAGTDQQPRGELYRESIDFTFTHDA